MKTPTDDLRARIREGHRWVHLLRQDAEMRELCPGLLPHVETQLADAVAERKRRKAVRA